MQQILDNLIRFPTEMKKELGDKAAVYTEERVYEKSATDSKWNKSMLNLIKFRCKQSEDIIEPEVNQEEADTHGSK